MPSKTTPNGVNMIQNTHDDLYVLASVPRFTPYTSLLLVGYWEDSQLQMFLLLPMPSDCV